jgi:hypothetical protein
MCWGELPRHPGRALALASLRPVAEATSGRLETRRIAVLGQPGRDATSIA